MTIRDLSEAQLEWFRNHFAETKNDELAEYLGISPRSVVRLAREYGLEKTKAFVAAMQRNASEHGARVTRASGGNAGSRNLLVYGKATRFKAGESNKDRMSVEAFADMHRRIGESRKETFRKERVRVNWGFEQRTKLRVVKCPKEKIHLRNKLRKRGYEIERASNEAYITETTRRSEQMEVRGRKMGITFIIDEQDGELQ